MTIEVKDRRIVGFLSVSEFSVKTGVVKSRIWAAINNGQISPSDVVLIGSQAWVRDTVTLTNTHRTSGKYRWDIEKKIQEIIRDPAIDPWLYEDFLIIGNAIDRALINRDGNNDDFGAIFRSVRRYLVSTSGYSELIENFSKMDVAKVRGIGPCRGQIIEQAKKFVSGRRNGR